MVCNGVYGGVMLTAVGIDPNNNTYPIAWAIVKNECYATWTWFLSCLEIDLGMENHNEWTWVSDKHKGLCKAFDDHFAASDNRFCVRHLHGNMKVAGFTGSATKEALWKMATATTDESKIYAIYLVSLDYILGVFKCFSVFLPCFLCFSVLGVFW